MADRDLRSSWRTLLVAGAVLIAAGNVAIVPSAGAQVEPPEITTDLSDRVEAAGGFVTLTATATGGPGDITTYVSTDDGATWSPISGCGNCSFTGQIILASVTLEDSGKLFRIEFTNDAGTVSTRAATLTVCPSTLPSGCGATLTVAPSEDVLSGEALEVTASGLPPSYPTWTVLLRTCQVEVHRCSAGETLTYAQDGTLTGTFHPSRLLNIAFECGINASCLVRASVGGAIVAEHPISFLPVRPDARLRNRDTQTIAFDDLYVRFGSRQTRSHSIELGGKWTYAVQVQNDGPNVDDMIVRAAEHLDGQAVVRYFVGYYDVTAAVTGGGFTFADMGVGEVRQFAVQFRAAPDAFGVPQTTVSMSSETDPTAQDVITLAVLTGRVIDPDT